MAFDSVSFLLQSYIVNEISDYMNTTPLPPPLSNNTTTPLSNTTTPLSTTTATITTTTNSNFGDNKLFYLLVSSILVPLLKTIFDNITNIFSKCYIFISDKVHSQENCITIMSFENASFSSSNTEFPDILLAICHWIIINNRCKKLRFIDKNKIRNGVDNNDYNYIDKNEEISYVLDETHNLLIEPTKKIYVDYKKDLLNNDKKEGFTKWSIVLSLKSTCATMKELREFNERCVKEYNEYKNKVNCKKTYYFTYQGLNDKEDSVANSFKMNVLSDDTSIETSNYETFETYFNEYKYDIIREYEKLHDIEFHRINGIKRKSGLLLHGEPGIGKTSVVTALANYLGRDANGNYYTPFNAPHDNVYIKRHILVIPPSRIKKNVEIEEIYNLTEINKIKFKKSEIIILFDEIDQFGKAVKNRTVKEGGEGEGNTTTIMEELTNNVVKSISQPDDLNLGSLLSQLDGIGNSNNNGLLTIATTNHLHLLDPALYRDGRLNLYNLENASTVDIVNMFEKRYATKPFEIKNNDINAYEGSLISSTVMTLITAINKKYAHSTIVRIMNKYSNFDELVTNLEQL
jgi:DNA replication protein DnaC